MRSVTIPLALLTLCLVVSAEGQQRNRSKRHYSSSVRNAAYTGTAPGDRDIQLVGCDECFESKPVCTSGCGLFGGLFSKFGGCGCGCGCGCGGIDLGCAELCTEGCSGGCSGGADCMGHLAGGCGLGVFGGGAGNVFGCGCCGGCDCGCSAGTTCCVPYPRCFPFKSPCVTNNPCCGPCCKTIFGEMFLDVKDWLACMSTIPGACCANSCPLNPVGFRVGGCSGGGCFGGGGCSDACTTGCVSCTGPCIPSFQELLKVPCRGCTGGCHKPSLLLGLGGMLFNRGGGCGGCGDCGCSPGGHCCGDGYGDDYYDEGYEGGYYDDGYLDQGGYSTGEGQVSGEAAGHRYYVAVRPGSKNYEYMSAAEYSRLRSEEAERAEYEYMAERDSRYVTRRARAPRYPESSSARRPSPNQQSRYRQRRSSRRPVERVSFDDARRRRN